MDLEDVCSTKELATDRAQVGLLFFLFGAVITLAFRFPRSSGRALGLLVWAVAFRHSNCNVQGLGDL